MSTTRSLDRLTHRRNEENLSDALGPGGRARILPLRPQHVLIRLDEPAVAMTMGAEEIDLHSAEQLVFLGERDGELMFAAQFSAELELPGNGSWSELRPALLRLGPDDAALVAYARAILHWNSTHRFCGRCGEATESAASGHERFCRNCDQKHFPRTDPAIITLVTCDDQALLGRQATWPEGMYSTLAGFVEPGETLEAAVAREVFEEAGVRVQDVRYFGSQPWPFPASLMIGFLATAADQTLHVDGKELSHAIWITRDELEKGKAEGSLKLPSRYSISRELIEHWRNEPSKG